MTNGIVHNGETYSSFLETKLNQDPRVEGTKFQVLNAGVGGYSTLQEYLWLQVYGHALQPDLIILGFYAGNDILEPSAG